MIRRREHGDLDYLVCCVIAAEPPHKITKLAISLGLGVPNFHVGRVMVRLPGGALAGSERKAAREAPNPGERPLGRGQPLA